MKQYSYFIRVQLRITLKEVNIPHVFRNELNTTMKHLNTLQTNKQTTTKNDED